MKMIQERFRAAVLVASVLTFAVGVSAQNQNFNGNDPNSNDNNWPYAPIYRSAPLLAVVGDVACQPGETEPSETEPPQSVVTEPSAPN